MRLRSAWLCAGLVLLATGSAVAWTLTAGTNDPPPGDAAGAVGSAWEALPGEFVLWWFQAVGAFPYRDEMASIWVYATLVPALGVLAALGARLAGARERWAMLLVVLASSAVPVVATLLTYERLGSAWQGRYGYPLALGFFVVCGLALDRYGLLLGQWWPVPVAVALACGAQLFGQLGVLRQQAATSPQAGTPAWWEPSPVLVAVLVLLGGLSLTAGLRGAGRRAIASSGGLAG